MSRVLRNGGSEQEALCRPGALSPSCPALAPLNFRSHLHSENTKASCQCWLFTLSISTTFHHLLLHFPETSKPTALPALQQISLHLKEMPEVLRPALGPSRGLRTATAASYTYPVPSCPSECPPLLPSSVFPSLPAAPQPQHSTR